MKKAIRRILIGLAAALVIIPLYVAIRIRVDMGKTFACIRADRSPPAPGETVARRLSSGGVDRCYRLYAPPGDDDQPSPLVLMLHGFGANSNFSIDTGWNEVAEREGFIVAYPEGTMFPLRWNSDFRARTEVDDTQFLLDIIDDIDVELSIDRSRVYVAGFSNGATMTIVAACQAAEHFAAIGPVDKGPTYPNLEECAPSRPVAMIVFDGALSGQESVDGPAEDQDVPVLFYKLINVEPLYVPEPDMVEWVDVWQGFNECTSGPQISESGVVTRTVYTDCAEDADVWLISIADLGHQWPGGKSEFFMGQTSDAVNATEEMWAFFSQQQLP